MTVCYTIVQWQYKGISKAYFGDPAKALDWLKTPTHVFGGKSPEEYASSGGGDEVDRILTRIEYGVFS